jgi:hypothetical protein
MRGDFAVIGPDLAEACDPAGLMAIVAHELCHVRLLGEQRIERSRPDQERLTDLLTVYLGLGLLTANAAFAYSTGTRRWTVQHGGGLDERTLNAARQDGYRRVGYLNEREFGYALACWSWLRDDHPDWAGELNPRARAALSRGLAYLERTSSGERFPTERVLRRGNVPITIVARSAGSCSPTEFVLPDYGVPVRPAKRRS